MIDWSYGLDFQAFEYWRVDPVSWADMEPVACVTSGTLVRDVSSRYLTSASLEVAGEMPEECILRCYMRVEQRGERARVPIDTWLSARTQRGADSAATKSKAALYGPLAALATRGGDIGNYPPIGYTAPAGSDCLSLAAREMRVHGVAPVTSPPSAHMLLEPYVAGRRQAWLDVCAALAAAGGCEIGCDAMGTELLSPTPVLAAARPVWTFHDGNSHVKSNILCDASEERATWLVPNVVEVYWDSTPPVRYARAVHDDERPLSTRSRGYEVVKRIGNPDALQASHDAADLDAFTHRELSAALSVTRKVQVSHPYCPVRVGDVVEVDYAARRIKGVGRIVRQTMKLETGGQMTSTVNVIEEVA